jgi:hypothetical protein
MGKWSDEILFRAVKIDSKEVEFIYGGYVDAKGADSGYIINIDSDGNLIFHRVIRDTVCMWSGYTDSKGQKIYNADICTAKFCNEVTLEFEVKEFLCRRLRGAFRFVGNDFVEHNVENKGVFTVIGNVVEKAWDKGYYEKDNCL